MQREYTVLSALAPTPVPVPRTLAYCADPAVIGAPFYLMEKVDGVIYRDAAALRQLDATAGQALGHALADTLAALHTVDPAAVGLAEFGHPEGFLGRQVRRWSKQLKASYTRPLPGAGELAERLAATEPVSGHPTVVHGDFRLDNVLVDPASPGRIAAVLDWEMSTLGDPLTDLGITCVYWDGLDGMDPSIPPSPGNLPGWPSRAELVTRYAGRSGVEVGALDWYVAFGYFKLAVILEGIYCRYAQGLTVGAGFDRIGAAVPELFARGHTTLG
jgi:aminoglycoside phosphotransferase (APT) family kinase protein